MRIPESIELALLKQRKEINKQAELFNKAASSEMSMVIQPEKLVDELEFWNIDDDEKLDDFILELPYALLLAGSEFDWSFLPKGYAPLVAAMEFELSCQNEGWVAISNAGEEGMQSVIEAYRYLGLNDEAAALASVLQKYLEIDDEDEKFHQILSDAYDSVKNSTPELEDRLVVVRNFVRENGRLFAV